MSRSKRVAVGRLEVGDDDVPDVPLVHVAVAEVAERRHRVDVARTTDDAPTRLTLAHRRDVHVGADAALGAQLERRADEVAEQRVRAVRAGS